MPQPRRSVPDDAALTNGFRAIRAQAGVSESFPADVTEAAGSAIADPSLDRADHRDLELSSIDPEGSRDLDQAFALERSGSGYVFWYAIADVSAFVTPAGPIDAEARRRGTTIYCPDERIPLHPAVLSEGTASLLPDEDRPALLWRIGLDQGGDITEVHVERALVRNRRALSYAGVQSALDDGGTDPAMRLLEEIGELRIDREVARGGVSLNLPSQEVVALDGHYELRFEQKLRSEDWNAELSLCCGMAAASLMLGAGFGLLRTMPPAPAEVIAGLRNSSIALGVAWPEPMPYASWVRALDVTTAAGVALMEQAARTLRGAGYAAFDGAPPGVRTHAAVNAPYAHVTAPLRRLADRFANECVLAAAAGTRPAAWVLEALPTMPATMAATARVANTVNHNCIDLTEAAVLQHRIGDVFDAVVTGVGKQGSTVQIIDPAVVASLDGVASAGQRVRAKLVAADITTHRVEFARV